MTEQELLELKQEIERKKADCAKLESRRELLLEQLKEGFNVSTIPAANKKLKEMLERIAEYDKQIESASDELEKQLKQE